MRLTLERFGGIAALPAKPLILDTADLPEAQAKQLESLAQRVLNESSTAGATKRAAPSKIAAAKPDAVSYELTIEAAKQRKAIPFDNAGASDCLRELLKAMRSLSNNA